MIKAIACLLVLGLVAVGLVVAAISWIDARICDAEEAVLPGDENDGDE